MKLWQKGAAAHQKVDHFTVGKDREYDLQLAAYDCEASMAHASMLAKIGLLSSQEAEQLNQVLKELQAAAKNGTFIDPAHELSQSCFPESRSKARTISFFLDLVSTVITRLPATMGEE